MEQAVARGYTGKQHPIGTRVQSVDTGDFAGTGCRHCGETVFTATLYTASQWIEAQAFAAKQAKKPFAATDVPAAMRQPVLYVIAQEVKNDLDLTANSADIGFRGIQLADEAQKIKVEPLMHKFTQQMGAPGSGLTGNVTTAAATAVFSQASVRGVLDQKKGDFWIVLTLPSGQKLLKVKVSAVKAAL